MSVGRRGLPTEQADAPGISLELPQLETALNRYDAFGRLVGSEVTKEGVLTQIAYTYDASGYRTSKTVDGVTTEHLLDGANVAADVANGQVTQYVRGLGLTALVQADGTRLQYVTDGHGDVKKLVSSSGTVVQDYTYDAFGNQTAAGGDTNPFRYAGEYWDSESGLIYLRARYYDSGVGAFTSADTHWNVGNMIYGDNAENTVPDIAAILQSGNLYVYCMGNPVNCIDPMGLQPYQLYNSAVEAATAWAKEFYAITDYAMIEVGAILYSQNVNGITYYGYTWSVVGTPHGVDLIEAEAWVPEGAATEGSIHSHMPIGTDGFSGGDNEKYNENPNRYNFYFVVSKAQNNDTFILRGRTKENATVYEFGRGAYYGLSQARRDELRYKLADNWYKDYHYGNHFTVDSSGIRRCVHGYRCAEVSWPNYSI